MLLFRNSTTVSLFQLYCCYWFAIVPLFRFLKIFRGLLPLCALLVTGLLYTYKGHGPLKVCLWSSGVHGSPVGNHWPTGFV